VASIRVIRWNKIIALTLLGHTPSKLLQIDENISAEFPDSPQFNADNTAHEAVRATLEAMQKERLPLDPSLLTHAAEKARQL
jgi:hypothetical protein